MTFDYSSPLNEKQRQAADHNHGPMLVRAGAGTGKTTVLTQRISRLVKQHVAEPHEILAITYTNAAAEEMQDRLEKVIGKEAAQKIHACTFHSYCNQVLRRYTRDTFKLLSTEDLWVYFRKNIDKLGLKHFAKASDPGTFLRSLNQFFERCNDELVNASDYADYVARLESDVSLELPRVGFSSK
ncbi:MAG TPA: UvrD-helicase domain-containing protein, partial [Terriglobales bacterium]